MDITELLKEARPLYKERKRQKTIAKLIFVICAPVFLFTSAIQLYNQGCDIYLSLEKNNLQFELLEDDFGIFR